MSLVNDMLKDLDDRRRESRIGKQRLVPAGRGRHALMRGGSVLSVLLAFALTVIAGMGYLLFADARDTADSDPVRLASAQQAEAAGTQANTRAEALVDTPVDTQAGAPADTQTDPSADTSAEPSAELLVELEQRLAELERQNQMLARQQTERQHTNGAASEAVNSSADSSIRRAARDGLLAADLPTPSATGGQREAIDTAPVSESQPLFAGPVSSDRSLQRSAVELSLEELDRQQVQGALQQWSTGRQLDALQALDNFAYQNPLAHQSREALAKLLLQQGELERAMQVADIGLNIAPAHAAYKKIKARLLFDRGQTAEALQILNNFVPSVHQDLEYHDLMAAAQLADRQYETALTTYQALLQQDPEVGRWWYGLATAMEPLGRMSEAVSAYERASQQPDLSLMLRQRSQQRLQELRAAELNAADSE